MSRCFPFPPPGYTKRLTVDHVDLLAKEKHKEKKRKKDKKEKDKEKEGGKENKDKGRHKDKHRDKEKKKERRKDKKRDKDLEKSKNKEEKRVEGQSDCSNVENSLETDQFKETSVFQDLGRKARKDGSATASQFLEEVSQSFNVKSSSEGARDKKTDNTCRDANEANIPKGSFVLNCDETGQKMPEMFRPMEKDVQNQRRYFGSDTFGGQSNNKAENIFRGLGGSSNLERFQTVSEGDKFKKTTPLLDPGRRVGPLDKMAESNDSYSSLGRGSFINSDSKVKVQKEVIEARGPKVSIIQSSKKTEQKRVEMFKPLDVDGKPPFRIDGAESRHNKEAKLENELNKDLLRLSEVRKDSADDHKPYLFKESSRSPAEGKIGKRKQPERDQKLHDDVLRPNKLPKLVSLDSPLAHNGMIKPAHEEKGTAVKQKHNKKEHKLNGVLDAQPSVAPTRPLSAAVKPEQTRKPSSKPPHPDTKYLNQILSIPKAEWSGFDDQEWLFGSNKRQPDTESRATCADAAPQVWAKAIHIESADVFALPFVLPY